MAATTALSSPSLTKTSSRTVCSNCNTLAYTYSNVTSRVHNIRKKRYLSTNATWTLPTLRFGWHTANNTSASVSYPTIFFQQSLLYNGTYYEGLFSGVNYKIVAGGDEVVTDALVTPSMSGEVEICTRIILPLLYKTRVADFQVGEVVTGTTSGATGTVRVVTNGASTGTLTLSGESGTWVNGEAVTGDLGGDAAVDLTTYQKLPASIGSQAIWNEGVLSTNNTDTSFQTSLPVTTKMEAGTVTISSGNITSVATAVTGVGYTAPSNVYAWEVGPDGVVYQSYLGYTNTAHTSFTMTGSGAPPTDLAAWVNPNITVALGGDFGNTTLIIDCTLMEAIPSTAVSSLRLIGDSITRGFSSTDSVGSVKYNFGPYERAIDNRVGIANMSTSGGALGNQVQFATTFALQYALFDGKCTQDLITLGSNDITAGATKSGVQANYATLATHCRSTGAQVGVGKIIQRGAELDITGISKAANAIITANNSLVGGETLKMGHSIGGMSQIRSLTATVVSATSTTITIDVDSTAFSTFAGSGVCYALAPTTSQGTELGFDLGGVADLHNTDIDNSVVISDFTPIDLRSVWQDPTVTTAWALNTPPYTSDLTHPSAVALAFAQNNLAFKAQFNQFV